MEIVFCKMDHFVNREFERGQGYICADAQASVYSKLTYTCKQHDPLYTIGKNHYQVCLLYPLLELKNNFSTFCGKN